jgi:hypothetical protein
MQLIFATRLNLTIANCVYLLEPQWNPMVEAQSVSRVQRLGQHKDVTVFRDIVADTVEEVRHQAFLVEDERAALASLTVLDFNSFKIWSQIRLVMYARQRIKDFLP